VQIEDSRVKFGRSPRPAGHALRRPASAVHLLVVSQPSVFHKGGGRLSGPRGVRGGGSTTRAASARSSGKEARADTSTQPMHSCLTSPWAENASQASKCRRLVRQPQT
jgi:hypothetical protein